MPEDAVESAVEDLRSDEAAMEEDNGITYSMADIYDVFTPSLFYYREYPSYERGGIVVRAHASRTEDLRFESESMP